MIQREKWIYMFPLLAIVAFILSTIFGKMGTLSGYIIQALGFVCLGIFFLVCGIEFGAIGENKKRYDWKFMLIGICMGGLFLVVGGKNLTMAGMDVAEGTVLMEISDCRLYQTTSLRRLFHSYYLEGEDIGGKRQRFPLDKETYQQLDGTIGDSVEVICWEHSKIIQQIPWGK